MLTQITEHIDQAFAKLLEQYRGKPRFLALQASYVGQIQELEDVIWDVLGAFDVDTCDLLRLKILGKRVGQVYRGEAVNDYRRYVKARILINRSHGHADEIIEIAELVLDGLALTYDEFYPAAIVMGATDTDASGADPALAVEMLREGKAAGVGFQFVWGRSAAFKFSATSTPNTTTSVGLGSTVTPGLGGKLKTVY